MVINDSDGINCFQNRLNLLRMISHKKIFATGEVLFLVTLKLIIYVYANCFGKSYNVELT